MSVVRLVHQQRLVMERLTKLNWRLSSLRLLPEVLSYFLYQ